ncbi:toll-like receptor 2 [Microcaecilia unicolor]|uniref:Toll-like receptor n=1 Tax=Microcaecilia unicolor TaxID=1415580 RepID=A0A6P7WXX1_9AMPH|nr:toll-like receptor 2 [Microcaecilia unicolor]
MMWMMNAVVTVHVLTEKVMEPVCQKCDTKGFCDCSSIDLKSIPSSLPRDIKSLNLSNNHIKHIRESDLRTYVKLDTLLLQFNEIQMIHNDSFEFLVNLEYLDLSNNNLTHFSSAWFRNLSSLKYLNILGNFYKTLGENSLFSSLSNLQYIKLGNPNFFSLEKKVFEGIAVLEELEIEGFGLKIYQEGSFRSIQMINHLILKINNINLVSKIFTDILSSVTWLEFRNMALQTSEDTLELRDLSLSIVEKFTLKNCNITDESSAKLVEIFNNCTLLLELELVDSTLLGTGQLYSIPAQMPGSVTTVVIKNLEIPEYFRFSALENVDVLLSKVRSVTCIESKVFLIFCSLSSNFKSLEYLDLRGNLLSNVALSHAACYNVKDDAWPSLQTLNLSKNSLASLSVIGEVLSDKTHLVNLDVSQNVLKDKMPNSCRWPSNLRHLNLSACMITTITTCVPNTLEVLDVSNNMLTEFVIKLPRLKELYISRNKLKIFPSADCLPYLITLRISKNKLSEFSKEDLESFNDLKTVDGADNGYTCSCSFLAFIQHNKEISGMLLGWPEHYICDSPSSVREVQVQDAKLSLFVCHRTLLLSVICIAMFLIIVITVILCYKLHGIWYIQMTWAWLKAKRKPNQNLVKETCYDAFVSYSERDSEWVENLMTQELEHATPPIKLCLHKRDFVPGKWIVDNIIDSIEKSRKTLFVLSEHFVQSEWCKYELEFSHFRLFDDSNDSAILILLEPIEKETIPKRFCKLRKLMNTKTYMEWPLEEDQQLVFWTNLKATLQSEELYNKGSFSEKSCESFFEGLRLPTLTAAQVAGLNGPIRGQEVQKVIKQLKLAKAPGPDGLMTGFYKILQNEIVPSFVAMCAEVYDSQNMGTTLNHVYITVLPKSGKDAELVGSYYPISLLNQDIKIMAAVLAARLSEVVQHLVHSDQVGFVKGRFASANVLKVSHILLEGSKEAGDKILASLDAEKAFDKVVWEYLFWVLRKDYVLSLERKNGDHVVFGRLDSVFLQLPPALNKLSQWHQLIRDNRKATYLQQLTNTWSKDIGDTVSEEEMGKVFGELSRVTPNVALQDIQFRRCSQGGSTSSSFLPSAGLCFTAKRALLLMPSSSTLPAICGGLKKLAWVVRSTMANLIQIMWVMNVVVTAHVLRENAKEPGNQKCDTEGFCDYSSMDLKSIPSALPREMKGLNLANNHIKDVRETDLRTFVKLETLLLQFNEIETIHRDSLVFLVNLEHLDLSNNKLTNLSSAWFRNLSSLKYLNILGNFYKTLGESSLFSSLSKLQYLKLGNPNFFSLKKKDFEGIAALEEFELEGRGLKEYEEGSFRSFLALNHFILKINNTNLVVKILTDIPRSVSWIEFRDMNLSTSGDIYNLTGLQFSLVQKITMKNCFFTDESTSKLIGILTYCNFLSEFELEDCELLGTGQWPLPPSRSDSLRTLVIKHLEIPEFFMFSNLHNAEGLARNIVSVTCTDTKVYLMPCPLSKSFQSLEYLDLSGNLLSNIPLEYVTCYNEGGGAWPLLKTLNLSRNSLTSLGDVGKVLSDHRHLINLDVSQNILDTETPKSCRWPRNLKYLNISSCMMKTITTCIPGSLEVLDVSNNKLTEFTIILTQLKELYISRNKLMTLPSAARLPDLLTLRISKNKITEFSEEDLESFRNLTTVDARDNSYICSCPFLAFIQHNEETSKMLLGWPEHYICDSPSSVREVQVQDARLALFVCHRTLLLSLICIAMLLVTVITVILCYKLHGIWYIKMTWAWLKAKRKPNQNLIKETCYDAFVSYSERDSEWVENLMTQELEHATPPIKLCLHKRDFVPGKWIVDNIIDSIEKSRKTLFVLSEHFVQSEWCKYELEFSHFRLFDDSNDSAILILLEPIEKETIPKRFCKLRKLMNTKTYMEWPLEEDQQQIFWFNLKAALQSEEF